MSSDSYWMEDVSMDTLAQKLRSFGRERRGVGIGRSGAACWVVAEGGHRAQTETKRDHMQEPADAHRHSGQRSSSSSRRSRRALTA